MPQTPAHVWRRIRHSLALGSPSTQDDDIESQQTVAGVGAGVGAGVELSTMCHHQVGSPVQNVGAAAAADPGGGAEQVAQDAPLSLMTIPQELQLQVVRQLDYRDIVQLRRTCHYYNNLITADVVSTLFGNDYYALLLSHCARCFGHWTDPRDRLCTLPTDANYPLSTQCVSCAVQHRDPALRVGRKVMLGNHIDYWVCRWCGWPVILDKAEAQPEYHRRCYKLYSDELAKYALWGVFHFLVCLIASSLAWSKFRHDKLVFRPVTTNYVLFWWCWSFLVFRSKRSKTYPLSFFFELSGACIYIVPVYSIVHYHINGISTRAPATTYVTLVFILLEMLIRFLNAMGNLLFCFMYDQTQHHIPKISPSRRYLNKWITRLIFWTYPQVLERKYPPYD